MKERDFDRLMLVAIVVLSILMMHSIITTAKTEKIPEKICEAGEDVYVNMEFVGCTDYHQSPANTWVPKNGKKQ